MSKRINVNPDHYRVAGRERPGKGVVNVVIRQPRGIAKPKGWKKEPRTKTWQEGQGENSEFDIPNSEFRPACPDRPLSRRVLLMSRLMFRSASRLGASRLRAARSNGPAGRFLRHFQVLFDRRQRF